MILHPLEIFQWGQEASKREAFADEWGFRFTAGTGNGVLKINAMEQMYRLLEEVSQQIEDLYQSGLTPFMTAPLGCFGNGRNVQERAGLPFLAYSLGSCAGRLKAAVTACIPFMGQNWKFM